MGNYCGCADRIKLENPNSTQIKRGEDNMDLYSPGEKTSADGEQSFQKKIRRVKKKKKKKKKQKKQVAQGEYFS